MTNEEVKNEAKSLITVRLHASSPIFVEADSDHFGYLFSHMNDEEQSAVLASMSAHMASHRMQWDYIVIRMEREYPATMRELRDIFFDKDRERISEVAPGLLEALKAMVSHFEKETIAGHGESYTIRELYPSLFSSADAAIAKAEGRSI